MKIVSLTLFVLSLSEVTKTYVTPLYTSFLLKVVYSVYQFTRPHSAVSLSFRRISIIAWDSQVSINKLYYL